jgi:hypothetical protein
LAKGLLIKYFITIFIFSSIVVKGLTNLSINDCNALIPPSSTGLGGKINLVLVSDVTLASSSSWSELSSFLLSTITSLGIAVCFLVVASFLGGTIIVGSSWCGVSC